MRAYQFIQESVAGIDGTLPAEPGSILIPHGTVRLYHQTSDEALHKIARHGLTAAHAKGIEGPKAIYASEKGFYGKPGDVPTLEFYVDKKHWDSPFVMQDVPTSQMIAAHLPWHDKARYMEEDPELIKEVLSGRYDDLTGEYKLAVAYIKNKYR
jgi:hypothetical protein